MCILAALVLHSLTVDGKLSLYPDQAGFRISELRLNKNSLAFINLHDKMPF